MLTNVADTSISVYHAHIQPTQQQAQCSRILSFIERRGGDWSIGEIARAMDMEKSTVSARLNNLLHTHQLVAKPHRKDRVSGITVRPLGLPGQGDLFV
jgi:DNA-binding MarR family transcriptional regulator